MKMTIVLMLIGSVYFICVFVVGHAIDLDLSDTRQDEKMTKEQMFHYKVKHNLLTDKEIDDLYKNAKQCTQYNENLDDWNTEHMEKPNCTPTHVRFSEVAFYITGCRFAKAGYKWH